MPPTPMRMEFQTIMKLNISMEVLMRIGDIRYVQRIVMWMKMVLLMGMMTGIWMV